MSPHDSKSFIYLRHNRANPFSPMREVGRKAALAMLLPRPDPTGNKAEAELMLLSGIATAQTFFCRTRMQIIMYARPFSIYWYW